MPRQGFVLSIFRSASAYATPTPWGEKQFGVEFNYAHSALKSKNILNLCSLPQNSALWSFWHENASPQEMWVRIPPGERFILLLLRHGFTYYLISPTTVQCTVLDSVISTIYFFPNMKIGHSVARMLAVLFHYDPQFRGKRAVTFHNQRDYIFFRHHR